MDVALVKRPKRGETDEELLRMQEEFLQSGEKPSVELVLAPGRTVDKRSTHADTSEVTSTSPDDQDVPSASLIPSVLCDIVERTVIADTVRPPTASSAPFPVARPRDSRGYAANGQKSVFASSGSRGTTSMWDRKEASSGSLSADDLEALHRENLERLQSMSPSEKLHAREELLARLDPSTVSFLRQRRSGMPSHESTRPDCCSLPAAQPQMLCASPDGEPIPKPMNDGLSLDETELPIRPSEAAQRWLHMDQVETEKLAWMTMLPPAQPSDPQVVCVGRFDFEGNLVAPSADLPTHLGLHHHGEDPQVAGYSSAEILRFLRSGVRSQQLMALRLLERMLNKHWQGCYAGCLEGGGLLEQLLSSGLAPLLRTALDNRSTLEPALATLRALLVSQLQQTLLERAFLWLRGDRSPFLGPLGHCEDVDSLPDLDLSLVDLVQALLRMDLLPRLHYVLDMCRPDANAVASALLVLSRISQHSQEAAIKVLEHPQLMKLIMEQFLPPHWGTPTVVSGMLNEAYGNPMWPALGLVRNLAAAGQPLAEKLLREYPLEQTLAAFLALEPSTSELPGSDCLRLALEALRTWRVLLRYGLTGHLCLDLFPVVARRLQLCSLLNLDGQAFDLEYGACLLHCLAMLPSDVVELTHQGLAGLLETSCSRWLHLLARDDTAEPTEEGLALAAAAIHSLTMLLGTRPCSVLNIAAVASLLKSQRFARLAGQLECRSLLLQLSRRPGSKVHNLKSCLPCLISDNLDTGYITPPGPVLFIAALARLLCSPPKSWPTRGEADVSTSEVCGLLLCHSDVVAYLQRLCGNRNSCLSWYCGPELDLLHQLVALASVQNVAKFPAVLYHRVSTALVADYAPGWEEEVVQLLERSVFHPNLAWAHNQQETDEVMEQVNVDAVMSATGSPVVVPSVGLDVCRLAAIRDVYLSVMSRWLPKANTLSVFLTWMEESSVPPDWIYLPLEPLCRRVHDPESAWDRKSVVECLHWAAHTLRSDHQSLGAIPRLVHYCRLASVFLAGPELFLDQEVQGLLLLLLHCLELRGLLCRTQRDLDLTGWPHLTPFSDFFPKLLEQYVGESYGDPVFANWLLVPMQAQCDPHFRRLFFTEHPEAIALTRLRPSQLVVPLQRFLEPPEQDSLLLEAYVQHLLSGRLDPDKNPLLHMMAVQGVGHLVRRGEGSPLKSHLTAMLSVHSHKEPVQRVLNWLGLDGPS